MARLCSKLQPTSVPFVYGRRHPEKTPLYRAVSENWPHFTDEHERVIGTWSKKTLQKFLECGLLDYGFARAHCAACGHDFLVAYSCQMRGVCPSCAAKRFEVLSRFVLDEVLVPIPHRQVVFTIPWALRSLFFKSSSRGLLFRTMKETLFSFFQSNLSLKNARPGIIAIFQSFGERLNFNPHLHCLVTDGAFVDNIFHPLEIKKGHCPGLEVRFAEKVFDYLIASGDLTPGQKANWRRWKHSGFSVDASVFLPAGQIDTTLRLLRYMARPAISNERIQYDSHTGQVTLLSTKKHRGKRKVVAKLNAFAFLKRLISHIPPKGSHLIRYYGRYASRTRSVLKETDQKVKIKKQPKPTPANRRSWARLIRQVYEVDPLRCPKCKGQMKFIAFVQRQQKEAIDRILDALQIDRQIQEPRGPPRWLQAKRAHDHIIENQNLYPEDFNQDSDPENSLLNPA